MPDMKDSDKNVTIQLDSQPLGELVLKERLDAAQQQLAAKQAELERIQNQLIGVYESAGANEALIRELELSKYENRALTKAAELKTDRVIELEGSLEISSRELNRTKADLVTMEAAFLSEQEQRNQLQNQLSTLEQKTRASFEMADISQYLTGVINDFNEAVNTADTSVNYIIRGLDVDMKAHIGKTEDDRMLMSAPSLTSVSAESLSSIKFTIAAVPKEVTASENNEGVN